MLTAVILTAGESKRMGFPKALLKYRQTTFLELILTRLEKAGIKNRLVVLGAEAERIKKETRLSGVKVVINRNFKKGQLSSLKTALAELTGDINGILLALVDHPLVKVSTYRLLIDAWINSPGTIVIPEFQGRGGHPVIFDRVFFSQLMNAPEEQGARYVVYNNQDRVIRVKVQDPGVREDIDSPEDYQRIK